jgi:putative DNA primase/helicase
MIDLNEVWQPPPRYDLDAIRNRLCATAADWLPAFFPHARMSADRKTLRCADLSGRAPRGEGSCVIHLSGPRAGWGFDHATGESAGPIDLIHHSTGVSGVAMFEEAAKQARLDRAALAAPTGILRIDHSHEIARIIAGCVPIIETVAQRYLVERGLEDPICPDLLFNDDLSDFDTKRGWCGMVAIVRDGAGEPTGGIHRTYLLDDGSAKAPPGKKMLGHVASGSVRLSAIGDDGHLGVAEGIETALSAAAIFNVSTWAALSADGLRRWEWPASIKRVTIFADAGTAGQQAAANLAERLKAAGIPHAILSPLHGDDFNDDLRHGASAKDYAGSAPSVSAPIPATVADFEAAVQALSKPPDLQALGRLLGQLVQARLEPLPERQVLASIKVTTGIPVTILDKQVGELRRRLNATGNVHERPVRSRWSSQLRLDLAGTPERNEANVITALSNDEAFAGVLMFDEFRQEILVARSLPWDAPSSSPVHRVWSDADDVRCAEWLQRREVNVPPVTVSRSVAAVARGIRIHPVRDYLTSLTWDGVARLENWTTTYLGAASTPLNGAFGSRWMISAVARIMRPGIKSDHMLILEGPQGGKKSSALKALAGEEWFTDELAEIGSKDAAQQMRGTWIIEIAELDAISRAEVSRIKAFLTRTTDRYRPPYERYVITVPRQCVFAGSVNPETYLRDETGNRRFWPIRCGVIDLDALQSDRDQLWAEAIARFQEGAIWWLDEPQLIELAKGEQERRYQADAWDAKIDRWLVFERHRVNHAYGNYDDWRDEEEVERTAPMNDVSVGEVLEGALGIEPAHWTRADQMRVTAYLKANGWERYQSRVGTGRHSSREWRYQRSSPTDT